VTGPRSGEQGYDHAPHTPWCMTPMQHCDKARVPSGPQSDLPATMMPCHVIELGVTPERRLVTLSGDLALRILITHGSHAFDRPP
jgi:hypothetical protein